MDTSKSTTQVERRFLAPSAGQSPSASEIVRVLVQESTQTAGPNPGLISPPVRGIGSYHRPLGTFRRVSPSPTPDEASQGPVEIVPDGAD